MAERTIDERIERLQQWVDATSSPRSETILDREIVSEILNRAQEALEVDKLNDELNDQLNQARMKIRQQKTRLSRLGDDYRCGIILGMATGSIRCYLPKGHDGECVFTDPTDALMELRKLIKATSRD